MKTEKNIKSDGQVYRQDKIIFFARLISNSCQLSMQEKTRKERKKAGLEAKVGGRMQTRKRQRLNEEKGVTAILKFKIPAGNLRISLGKTFMNE